VTVAVPIVIAAIGALNRKIQISSKMIATVKIGDWFEASNLCIGEQIVVILLTVCSLAGVTVGLTVTVLVMTRTVLVMTLTVLVNFSLRGHPLTSVPEMMM
jgi:hypothetical protein